MSLIKLPNLLDLKARLEILEQESNEIYTDITSCTARMRKIYDDVIYRKRQNPDLDLPLNNEEKAAMGTLQPLFKKMKANRKASAAIQKKIGILESADIYLDIKKELFNNHRIVCVDTEEYEFNNKYLLEVGVAIYEAGEIVTRHFIVSNNITKSNGKQVANNRDNYNFGISEILTLKEIENVLKTEVFDRPCLLSGHAIHNDISHFLKYGIDRSQLLDSQSIARRYFKIENELGLKNMVINLFPVYNGKELHLHNAGNDAFWTLRCIQKMLTDV